MGPPPRRQGRRWDVNPVSRGARSEAATRSTPPMPLSGSECAANFPLKFSGSKRCFGPMPMQVAVDMGRDDVRCVIRPAIAARDQMLGRCLEPPRLSGRHSELSSENFEIAPAHGLLAIIAVTALMFEGNFALRLKIEHGRTRVDNGSLRYAPAELPSEADELLLAHKATCVCPAVLRQLALHRCRSRNTGSARRQQAT
jgi:hypothetical protein